MVVLSTVGVVSKGTPLSLRILTRDCSGPWSNPTFVEKIPQDIQKEKARNVWGLYSSLAMCVLVCLRPALTIFINCDRAVVVKPSS